MNGEIKKNIIGQYNKKELNSKTVKYILISALIILVAITTSIIYGAYNILTYQNIYSGVYVEDIHVGGQSAQAAIEILNEQYKSVLEDNLLTLEYKDNVREVRFKEVDAVYNLDDAISQAFDIGRKGNKIKKIYTVSKVKRKNIVIPLEIHYDQIKIENILEELANKGDKPIQEYTYEVEGNRLKVRNGVRGHIINIEDAVQKISDAILEVENKTIEVIAEIVFPKAIDINEFYEKVCQDPQDARYEIKNYRLTIIPHKPGVEFDKDDAKKIIEDNNSEGHEFYIPITLNQPKILKSNLEGKFFKNKLSEYTTNFNSQQTERTNNVVLSANKINGTVLGPGDVFSYNNVVGRRTPEKGYQNAQIFVDGEIVDGLGGGICQVSSTLYNAALFSDLSIVSRINHSLTVGYVPMGQDATVAYGSIDFKFKNDTKWPIKINSNASGGRVVIEIWGTDDGLKKAISIENIIIETIPFTTKYIDDDTIEEGKEIVKQRGGNGYIVDTYKIKKENGSEISRDRITRSTYNPLEQTIARGTKKTVKPPQSVQHVEPGEDDKDEDEQQVQEVPGQAEELLEIDEQQSFEE